MKNQLIKTPCGDFSASGTKVALYNALPEHKFGWSIIEFIHMYDRYVYTDVSGRSVLDLTE